MQNLLNETEIKTFKKTTVKHHLDINDIEKFYLSNSSDFKIGLEYERLSLDKESLKNADYERVSKIIEDFCSITNWNITYDENTIIGACDSKGSSVSLEPGMQFELSLAPEKNIDEINFKATKLISLLDKIASSYNVIFLGYAISPLSCVDEIKILNKRRYQVMNKTLPYLERGELCRDMMRRTAGIQVNVDYKDKTDCFNKLQFLNLIAPFMSGVCSNSPFEKGKISNFKSLRSNIWRYSGSQRCNLFYDEIFNSKLFKHQNIFKNYIDKVLDVPMIFIERDDKYIEFRGHITFREFMKSGYCGCFATLNDYMIHQSLCFPDIRLKNYIEVRCHDSNNFDFALALCAFYKGLLKCDIKEMLEQLKFLKIKDVPLMFEKASKNALDFDVTKNYCAWDVVEYLLNCAKNSLENSEKHYLGELEQKIKLRKTSSDLIIENKIQSAHELIDYLTL